jgi:HK97 family phage portal protein
MEQPDIMPPQDLIIESGGWRQMAKYYRLQNNQRIPMNPDDIWHTRIFLNLDFTDGKNYRGLAPISVAADIIRAMSETNKTIYQTLKKGLPPGILRNTDIKTQKLALESQALLDEEWDKKFAGSDNRGRPILGSGNLEWIPIGFSNFRDLQLIEASSMGRSILCNLWGVPEELFSSERSTLDNKNTARKLAYEDSTIPICQDYVDGLNKRIEPAYGITYKIDINAIPAMQEDKYKIAQTMEIGRRVKAVTKNEFREAVGLETIADSEFDQEGLIDESAMPEQFAQYQQGTRL